MRQIAAKADIARIEATGERFEMTDSKTRGLRLRVSAAGVKSWSLLYRAGGGFRRLDLGTFPDVTLAKAREDAEAHKGAIRKHGADPQQAKATQRAKEKAARVAPKARSVGAVCAAYLETRGEGDLRKATRDEWARMAARIADHFGDLAAKDLDRPTVREWLRALRSAKHPTKRDAHGHPVKVKGYSANRSLEFLRLALDWATEEGQIPANPAAGLKRPSKRFRKNHDILAEEKKRARALSVAELRAVLLALDQIEAEAYRPGEREATADAFRLALLTGKRRRGVLGLRRSELSGLGGPEALWATPAEREKNAEAHKVPLSPAALAVIRRRLDVADQRREDAEREAEDAGSKAHPSIGEFLFATSRDWAKKGTDAAAANAEPWWARPEHEQQWLPQRFVKLVKDRAALIYGERMTEWTPHSLRATFASRLFEDLGVEITLISQMLNHRIANTSADLGYVVGERLMERRAALVAWAARVEEIKAGKTHDDDAQESARAKVLPMIGRTA